ncbi:MAG: hypothetical protein WCI73_09665, partial [Phycisphaerae bacterium]
GGNPRILQAEIAKFSNFERLEAKGREGQLALGSLANGPIGRATDIHPDKEPAHAIPRLETSPHRWRLRSPSWPEHAGGDPNDAGKFRQVRILIGVRPAKAASELSGNAAGNQGVGCLGRRCSIREAEAPEFGGGRPGGVVGKTASVCEGRKTDQLTVRESVDFPGHSKGRHIY